MRKKLATITRLDPAYAAALRSAEGEDPGRGQGSLAQAVATAETAVNVEAEGNSVAAPDAAFTPPQLKQETAVAFAPRILKSSPRIGRVPATRKIDIRVNALERQEEALIDCGVDPAHVIRAALRRAVKGWKLGPEFSPTPEEQRSRITEWQARTSLAVDADALAVLLRSQDPLDVLSKWTLIRGQVEPRIWAAIDIILAELAQGPDAVAQSVDKAASARAEQPHCNPRQIDDVEH